MPLDRQTLHVTSQLSSGIWQVLHKQQCKRVGVVHCSVYRSMKEMTNVILFIGGGCMERGGYGMGPIGIHV